MKMKTRTRLECETRDRPRFFLNNQNSGLSLISAVLFWFGKPLVTPMYRCNLDGGFPLGFQSGDTTVMLPQLLRDSVQAVPHTLHIIGQLHDFTNSGGLP